MSSNPSLNPQPTKLTVTKVDGTTDVLTIPTGLTYATYMTAIARAQGYWNGLTFVSIYYTKNFVAS